jgi:alkylhydroperoxidase family enzyme
MTQPNHRSLRRRTASDTEGDVQRVLGKLEQSSQNLVVLQLMANSPHLFRPFVLFANALLNQGVLPRPVLETVVLWLAQHSEASYEWEEHVPMARAAGLSDEQIESLRSGVVGPELFDEDQCLAVDFAQVLVEQRSVPDELWAQALQRWGTEATLDLVLIVGWWGGLVLTLVRALGLRDPAEG